MSNKTNFDLISIRLSYAYRLIIIGVILNNMDKLEGFWVKIEKQLNEIIDLNMTNKKDLLLEKFEEIFQLIEEENIELIAADVQKELSDPRVLSIQEYNEKINDFYDNNLYIYGSLFNLFDRLILLHIYCQNQFESLSDNLSKEQSDNEKFKSQILFKIHANIILIAKEISCLLKSGFSDGAMARTRTLHEAIIIFIFIMVNRSDVAKRYYEHGKINNFKSIIASKKYTSFYNINMDINDYENIYSEYKKAIKMNPKLKEDYGWCFPEINKGKRRIFLSDIEKYINFSQIEVWRIIANRSVHADSKSIYTKLAWGMKDLNFDENIPPFMNESHKGILDVLSYTFTLLSVITMIIIIDSNNYNTQLVAHKFNIALIVAFTYQAQQSEIKLQESFKVTE